MYLKVELEKGQMGFFDCVDQFYYWMRVVSDEGR